MSKALEAIAAERRHQIEDEGWTIEHDDEHSQMEMARAAAVYAYTATLTPDAVAAHGAALYGNIEGFSSIVASIWPATWANFWFKPKGSRYDLVRAAALLRH